MGAVAGTASTAKAVVMGYGQHQLDGPSPGAHYFLCEVVAGDRKNSGYLYRTTTKSTLSAAPA